MNEKKSHTRGSTQPAAGQFTLKLPSDDLEFFNLFKDECKRKGKQVNKSIIELIRGQGLTSSGMQKSLLAIMDKLDQIERRMSSGTAIAKQNYTENRLEALETKFREFEARMTIFQTQLFDRLERLAIPGSSAHSLERPALKQPISPPPVAHTVAELLKAAEAIPPHDVINSKDASDLQEESEIEPKLSDINLEDRSHRISSTPDSKQSQPFKTGLGAWIWRLLGGDKHKAAQ